jgi:hypothetical protein
VSAFNDIDVECPNCGDKFKGTVWTAIHAVSDPELKEMLVGGELNILFCPHCSNTFFYEHFLIYQDPRLKLVAYVYPPEEETRQEELEILMKRSFDEAQETFELKDRLPYGPTLFFGLDQLKDYIIKEEERLLAEEVEKAKRQAPSK